MHFVWCSACSGAKNFAPKETENEKAEEILNGIRDKMAVNGKNRSTIRGFSQKLYIVPRMERGIKYLW